MTDERTTDVDVVVLGAGFTGLYAMYKFRDQMGLSVLGLEPADGPGGVWFWNRYPGARCDFPSLYYSFSFSPEVDREWRWSEQYAAQPEIRAYLDFVCDRLDLRRSFDWGVGAESLTWDDHSARWIVPTSDGRTITARFVICGTGGLSIAKQPDFPGSERFRGEYYTTRGWPDHPVSFEGKRVGVIGTGASGIQVIQEVAKTAGELVVFQRTPNFATPMRNRPYSAEEQDWNAAHMTDIRSKASPVSGADLGQIRPSIFAESPEDVRARLTELYEAGGLGFAFASYADVLYDPDANAIVADFIREQIRSRVHDPKVAELLCPTDHPYTGKRPPLETSYFEVYNQPNVTLVDVGSAPIVEVTENGVRTTDGEYELDMIITALGFDAFTGAQLAMPMVGRGGVRLADYWAGGPLDYLGMAIHDFPNYFQFGVGPSAASQHNNAPLTERQIDFAAAAIETALHRGAATIEPTAEADAQWKLLCDGLIPYTLLPLAKSTWFLGHNIEGKQPGGLRVLRRGPAVLRDPRLDPVRRLGRLRVRPEHRCIAAPAHTPRPRRRELRRRHDDVGRSRPRPRRPRHHADDGRRPGDDAGTGRRRADRRPRRAACARLRTRQRRAAARRARVPRRWLRRRQRRLARPDLPQPRRERRRRRRQRRLPARTRAPVPGRGARCARRAPLGSRTHRRARRRPRPDRSAR